MVLLEITAIYFVDNQEKQITKAGASKLSFNPLPPNTLALGGQRERLFIKLKCKMLSFIIAW